MNKVGSWSLWIILVSSVAADYQLSVTVYSYSNPENKCAACRDSPLEPFGCCDNHFVKDAAECNSVPGRQCEVQLFGCLVRGKVNRGDQCPRNSVILSSSETSPFEPPLPFVRVGTEWDASLLHIVLNDFDFDSGFELIDSFVLNFTVGTRINRTLLTGQFGLATVELELSLVCTDNYYGPDCSRFCAQSPCTCDPGFTGEFCQTSINGMATREHTGAIAGGVAGGVLFLLLMVLLTVMGAVIGCLKCRKKTSSTNDMRRAAENAYQCNPGFKERELDNPVYEAYDDELNVPDTVK